MDVYSIYPKQFRTSKIPIEKNRCFVLMPFAQEYDKLYGTIKDTLTDMGITCLRDDEIYGSQPFMNKVITEILRSRYLIVILTDYRPNVLYELGIAQCFKDIQNILILIDKKSKMIRSIHEEAADLSHLTYVEYDINNTLMIRANIREFIKENESAINLQDYLYEKGIIVSITENTTDFITFLKEKFNSHFDDLTNLILGNNLDSKIKNKILVQLNDELYNQIDQKGNYIDILIIIFAECIIAAKELEVSEQYINSFISDAMIRNTYLSETLKNQWKIDFIVYIASQGCFLDTLLPWIIKYFNRTKSSTIDLNRYKLESFLINTSISKIDEALCNALRQPAFHIREHISDIIGTKHLTIAYSSLCNALVDEPSLYAGKSIIVALGKIGTKTEDDAAKKIIEWLTKNINRICASGEDFTNSILTKSATAILQLSPSAITQFKLMFEKYITDLNY